MIRTEMLLKESYIISQKSVIKEPLVSVIMPINHAATEELISRAVISVLNQSFTQFELIIVDDQASETIKQEITKCITLDSRIIYIQNQYSSELPAVRINQAITLARGKYIAYLFYNEFFEADALQNLFNAIVSQIKPCLVYGYTRITNGERQLNNLVGNRFEYYRLVEANFISLSAVLHHKSLFASYGGFDCHIAMKHYYVWDLWLRWSKTVPFIFLDKVVNVIEELDTTVESKYHNISNTYISAEEKAKNDKNIFRVLISKGRNEILKPENINSYEIDNIQGFSRMLNKEIYHKYILPWYIKHREIMKERLNYNSYIKKKIILVTKATFDSTIDITIMNFKELLESEYSFIYIPASQLDEKIIQFVDVVILHRTCDCISSDFLRKCKKKRLPVFYLLDDDLLNIYKLGAEFSYLAPGTAMHNDLIYQITNADAVISYSTYISQLVLAYNQQVFELRTNILSKYLNNNKEHMNSVKHKTTRIAFVGGNARKEELEFIWEDLIYISERYKNHVEFYFWGYIPERINQINKSNVYKSDFTTSYYEYLSRLMDSEFDIVLSPLFAKETKIAKCPIKYLEATISGAVGVYSDVIPYSGVLDEINGIKAKNLKGEWREKIEKVIKMDRADRQRIVENARAHIRKQYTTESQLEMFEATIQSGILHSRIGKGTVFYVVHSGYLGGAENHLLRHAILAKKNSFDIWVCIPSFFKGKKERVEQICIENGLKVHFLNYSIYTDVVSIDVERAEIESKAFVELALQYKARIFHSDTLIPSVQIACSQLNIPHIASVYAVEKNRLGIKASDTSLINDDDISEAYLLKNSGIAGLVTRKVLPKYIHNDSVYFSNIWHEGIGAEARCIRSWIPKVFFEKGEYNSVIDLHYSTEKSIANDKKQEQKSIVLGVCGTVQERKGQHKLIEAVGCMKQMGIKVMLNIIGYNHFFVDYMKHCQSIIQKYQIEEQIHFIGFVQHSDEELSKLDALICASDWESFPQVILEAMAMRIPVISTPVAGVPELVRERITGYLTKGYEVDDLVAAISKFINDYENDLAAISKIVDRASTMVYEECNEYHVTKELFAYYNDILANL